jgi:ankyrin repeat protein
VVIDPAAISSSPTYEKRVWNVREAADLYVYCSYRNWDLAREQVELNRGLDYVSTNRRFSVLHVAVENNAPVDLICSLLFKGVNPNVRECLFKQTALHVIMKVMEGEGNPLQVMEVLIDQGADVNAKAKYDRTPLYFALKHRVSVNVVARLLQAGATISRDLIIFAREKSLKDIVNLLEKVRIMVALCSVHLPSNRQKRRTSETTIDRLPKELFRELKVMLAG